MQTTKKLMLAAFAAVSVACATFAGAVYEVTTVPTNSVATTNELRLAAQGSSVTLDRIVYHNTSTNSITITPYAVDYGVFTAINGGGTIAAGATLAITPYLTQTYTEAGYVAATTNGVIEAVTTTTVTTKVPVLVDYIAFVAESADGTTVPRSVQTKLFLK